MSGSGKVGVGPEIQVSDGLVIRLVRLDAGDTPIVDARFTDRSEWISIEVTELVAMLDLASGRPVTDVHGFTHQGGETWRSVR